MSEKDDETIDPTAEKCAVCNGPAAVDYCGDYVCHDNGCVWTMAGKEVWNDLMRSYRLLGKPYIL